MSIQGKFRSRAMHGTPLGWYVLQQLYDLSYIGNLSSQ